MAAERAPRPSDRRGAARWFEAILRDRAMPYWCRTADPVHGGYRLADRAGHPPAPLPPRKLLVTQGRMLYGLSLAHRLGLDQGDACLRAARLGFRFLEQGMLDRECGGMVASTEDDGRAADDRKLLCGHAFAIYGLVEFHRATTDPAPLALALQLYRTWHARLGDREHGGWIEHADRRFQPLRYTFPPDRRLVGVAELRSADAMLHWMEALSELYEASREDDVRESLAEALELNLRYFFPAGDPVAHHFRTREWRAPGGSRYETLSYGHNVEFAWLMLRAQEVLGRNPHRDRFDALVDHALRFGIDHERGGIFFGGRNHGPATDRRKAWWVQAEALAALCDRHRLWPTASPRQDGALDRLLEWIMRRQILPEDGIWISVLDARGGVIDPTKAGPWKGAYHEVRAMVKFIETFR